MFYAYKVVVIGSIYGLIRFVVSKAVDAYNSPRRQQIEVAIDEVVYFSSKSRLVAELKRIYPPHSGSMQCKESTEWLHQAISEKMEKDGPPKK